MSDQSYGGWSTHATQLVNRHFGDIILDMIDDRGGFQSAKQIEQIVNDVLSEVPPFQDREPFDGFVKDVMKTFLRNVNWLELEDRLNKYAMEEASDV